MKPAPSAPTKDDTDARYQDEEPEVIGDFGQDDAFSTESHPEGLRYGEKKRPPGEEYHGSHEAPPDKDDDNAPLSVGPDGDG